MLFIEEGNHNIIKPCAATIGCFDGVHTGHRYLVDQVRNLSDEKGLKAALITFPVHPRQVMQSDYLPQLLSCLNQKKKLIGTISNADYCIMLPFTRELSMLTAREFMKILKEKYNVQALVIGHDHRFGHNRSENFNDYLRYGKELGIEIVQAKALTGGNGQSISSSSIRRLLNEGEIETANSFLGYRYYIDGSVISGHKIGRKIGFPTANILPSCAEKLIPAQGVYAVYVYVDGHQYKGMLNIGNRPTLNNGSNISIEVHIIDFCQDIYNTSLRIEFVTQVRKEVQFSSVEELVQQLHKDKKLIQTII